MRRANASSPWPATEQVQQEVPFHGPLFSPSHPLCWVCCLRWDRAGIILTR